MCFSPSVWQVPMQIFISKLSSSASYVFYHFVLENLYNSQVSFLSTVLKLRNTSIWPLENVYKLVICCRWWAGNPFPTPSTSVCTWHWPLFFKVLYRTKLSVRRSVFFFWKARNLQKHWPGEHYFWDHGCWIIWDDPEGRYALRAALL